MIKKYQLLNCSPQSLTLARDTVAKACQPSIIADWTDGPDCFLRVTFSPNRTDEDALSLVNEALRSLGIEAIKSDRDPAGV
jgi:hypothetical protein